MKKLLLSAWAGGCIVLCASAAAAQDYPNHPITIIAASAPGGALDSLIRIVGNQLSRQLNTPVIIENRPGANSTIGASAVARARPDGYTLLATSENALTIAPTIMPQLPYSATKDLTPISLLATLPMVLVVNAKSNMKTVGDFVDFAKKNPGVLRYGSAGDASVHYIGMESLRKTLGIDMLHVPYRAGPQAMTDLLGANIDTMLLAVGPAQQQASGGKLVALGVTSAARLPSMPDVPTVASSVPGYTFEAWFGLFSPANVPKSVSDKLNQQVRQILSKKEVIQELLSAGIIAQASSPAELRSRIEADRKKVQEIVKK